MRGAGKVLFAAAASILPWTHWAAGAPELYLNESFQGAARLVQSLPDTAAWFSATDSSHVVHDPSQGTLTLLSAPSASRHVIGYFTDEGAPPVVLAVGERLRVDYEVEFTNPNATDFRSPNNSFRVGLFDSRLEGTGVSRIDADNLGGVSSDNRLSYFDSYVGYRFDSVLHPMPTASPARAFRRNEGSSGKALLVVTSAYSGELAGGGVPLAFGSGVYHGEIIIQRTASDAVRFSHRLYHPSDPGKTALAVYGNDAGSAAVYAFDTIAFALNSRVAESFTLHRVKVTRESAGSLSIDVGSRTVSVTKHTPDGVPVVSMWDAPTPKGELREGAGFQVLDAEHAVVWQPEKFEDGAYNHYATLVNYEGRFFAMWGNHPLGEDGPGQRVLFAWSDEWGVWSEAKELFPPPGPVKPRSETGIHLKPDRWVVIDGDLYAVTFVFDAGSYAIARRVHRDGTFDPAFYVGTPPANLPAIPAFMDGVAAPVYAEEVAQRIRDWYPANNRVSWWGRNGSTGQKVPRMAVDGATLIESFSYKAKEGGLVLLARNWGHNANPVHNNRLYVTFSDEYGSWGNLYPTDIPDSPSRADALELTDGTVLLIGNQNVAVMDQPVYLDRDPITVSISEDGYSFRRVYALRTGSRSHFRFPGIGGRNHGFAYSSSTIHDGWLYTFYSVSKEDMEITRVRLSELGLSGDELSLHYKVGPGGRIKSGDAQQSLSPGDDGTPVEVEGTRGAIFSGWSDGVKANPRTDLNVTEAIEVEAAFVTPYGTPIEWYVSHEMEPGTGEEWSDVDERDSDGDGQASRSEYIAGTNPADPDSVLRPTLSLIEAEVVRLSWSSAPGRNYDVLLANRIDADDWPTVPGYTGIVATPPTNVEDFGLEDLPSKSLFRLRVNANPEGPLVD